MCGLAVGTARPAPMAWRIKAGGVVEGWVLSEFIGYLDGVFVVPGMTIQCCCVCVNHTRVTRVHKLSDCRVSLDVSR